jgi:hypothetical protein
MVSRISNSEILPNYADLEKDDLMACFLFAEKKGINKSIFCMKFKFDAPLPKK